MQPAATPRAHTNVLAKMDILETDDCAQVLLRMSEVLLKTDRAEMYIPRKMLFKKSMRLAAFSHQEKSGRGRG